MDSRSADRVSAFELVRYEEAHVRRCRARADLDLGGKLSAIQLPGGDVEVLSDDVALGTAREQFRIAYLAQAGRALLGREAI